MPTLPKDIIEKMKKPLILYHCWYCDYEAGAKKWVVRHMNAIHLTDLSTPEKTERKEE